MREASLRLFLQRERFTALCSLAVDFLAAVFATARVAEALADDLRLKLLLRGARVTVRAVLARGALARAATARRGADPLLGRIALGRTAAVRTRGAA